MRLLPFIVIVFFLVPLPLYAAGVPKTCDEGFYESLKAKAWLEGQREMTVNENILYKPDSILQYSCYNASLKKNDDINKSAKNELFKKPQEKFLENNFSHTTLGSTADPIDPNADSYANCNIMNTIWAQAKCGDFQEDSAATGFTDFSEYANSGDRRTLISQCEAPEPITWDAALAAAYLPDNVDTNDEIYKIMDPESCGSTPVIPTGIFIFRKGTQNEEKVCAAPGCYYDGGTCTD